MPCRINKRREWTGRIILESSFQETLSSFVTLTYSDENIPPGENLEVDDFKYFIKNVRNIYRENTVRFFGVGEYGDRFQRPHYHVALFGIHPLDFEDKKERAWKNGHVHVGEITDRSAAYIAGYTVKKLTVSGIDALEGRHPEFARMSKYPPIGSTGAEYIAGLLNTRCGKIAMRDREDVPSSFQIAGKKFPISKYWRKYLRQLQGIHQTPPPREITEDEQERASKKADKLFNVRNKTWNNRKKF